MSLWTERSPPGTFPTAPTSLPQSSLFTFWPTDRFVTCQVLLLLSPGLLVSCWDNLFTSLSSWLFLILQSQLLRSREKTNRMLLVGAFTVAVLPVAAQTTLSGWYWFYLFDSLTRMHVSSLRADTLSCSWHTLGSSTDFSVTCKESCMNGYTFV